MIQILKQAEIIERSITGVRSTKPGFDINGDSEQANAPKGLLFCCSQFELFTKYEDLQAVESFAIQRAL